MFARLAAHRYQVECDNVHFAGLDRCEIVRETQILAASLFDRLPRKVESQTLRFLIFVVDDQVVAFGLTREIAVHYLCFEEFSADRIGLQFFKSRTHLVGDYLCILVRFHSALLILPLTFE